MKIFFYIFLMVFKKKGLEWELFFSNKYRILIVSNKSISKKIFFDR